MKSKAAIILVTFAVALVTSWMVADLVQAQEKKFTYVGAKTCKMCHNKPAEGAQYDVWAKTPHANAYAVLASPESKAKAKEMGIDDPQKSDKCLKCHVTAFPVMASIATEKITLEEGVSCESCHGAGSEYKTKAVKEAVKAGTTKPEAVGLRVAFDEKFCVTCHTAEGNPFHKEFKYAEAVKKIAHPIPKG